MATYEFGGISTEQYTDIKEFIEYQDDGLIIETEPFTVELDNKEVKLHLYIEDLDMSNYSDSTEHIIYVGVIPAFDSLSKENQWKILEQFMPEDRENTLQNKDSLLFDIFLYGMYVSLRSQTESDPEKVEHLIKSAIAVRHGVSGLIGFELDRYQNRIGNTGWDLLGSFCENKDLIRRH